MDWYMCMWDGWMALNGLIGGWVSGWMGGWKEGGKERRTDGWMDGWVGAWVDGYHKMYICICFPYHWSEFNDF